MEEDQPDAGFDLEARALLPHFGTSPEMPPRGTLTAPTRRPSARAQAYIANYSGFTKVQRLVFIADKTTGKPMEVEALKLAVEELRRGSDTETYGTVASRLAGLLPGFAKDQ